MPAAAVIPAPRVHAGVVVARALVAGLYGGEGRTAGRGPARAPARDGRFRPADEASRALPQGGARRRDGDEILSLDARPVAAPSGTSATLLIASPGGGSRAGVPRGEE